MNKSLTKLKRPLVWCVLYFILGIVGASYEKVCPYILFISTSSIIYLAWKCKQKMYLLFTFCLILGQMRVMFHPVVLEGRMFTPDDTIVLEGRIKKIQKTQFGNQILLSQVRVKKNAEMIKLRSKVLIEYNRQDLITLDDYVWITGTIKSPPIKMNPSDMDYLSYLKSQGIVMTVKVKQMSVTRGELTFLNCIYNKLIKRINEIWQGKDQGLITGMLIGDTNSIPEDITKLYQRTGIAHILAVSGFNIGLIISIVFFICSEAWVSYRGRHIASLVILWIYTFLTGMGVAILRAAIMATLVIIAKCIWEESDDFINLALAAWIILFINPFWLYQVGFLISFFAVGSLFCGNIFVEKLKALDAVRYKRLVFPLIYWVCVSLGIYPILAYFFYEIPFLASILNLVITSLFSVIIVLACVCLFVSIYNLEAAKLLGELSLKLLDFINSICGAVSEIPLATLCTGKPSLVTVILIYTSLFLVMLYIKGYVKQVKLALVPLCLLVTGSIISVFTQEELTICHLYIGQGDAAVITTKSKNAILIDGGNSGKGKVIQKYLKYKGLSKLKGIIVSHADEDHIGGVIDLLNMGMPADWVIISGLEDNQQIRTLFDVCNEKDIPVYKAWYQDKIVIGEVEISCLTPNDNSRLLANSNQKSIVCLLKYKEFEELFTGDIDVVVERMLLGEVEKIDVLKVAHHGSKTSTSDEFVRKTDSKYAILSCGINNLYKHPHSEVMNRLAAYDVHALRTDLLGAVTIKTNGKRITIDYQVKGEQVSW